MNRQTKTQGFQIRCRRENKGKTFHKERERKMGHEFPTVARTAET